jgi:copper homeostasis protein (lipoprotein)
MAIAGACERTTELAGMAVFDDSIAVPTAAVFEAVLEDVSLADVPARQIGQIRIERAATSPIEFRIAYRPEQIQPRHRYAVRATIRVDGTLWLTTDTVYPVLTNGITGAPDLQLTLVADRATQQVLAFSPDVPVVFEGVLPCADCAGIDHRLVIGAGQRYDLGMRYLGREQDAEHAETGSWSFDPAAGKVTLRSDGGNTRYFRVIDGQALRMLDRQGEEIESALNYALQRTSD